MQQLELDSIVKAAASDLKEEVINEAKMRIEVEVDDECWNRNNRLNMIAYEDRQ